MLLDIHKKIQTKAHNIPKLAACQKHDIFNLPNNVNVNDFFIVATKDDCLIMQGHVYKYVGEYEDITNINNDLLL